MATKAPARINDIEDATTARWLARALEPGRARAREAPTAEAIDRIRARVFDEMPGRKPARSIAA